jgi:hypothetical protein
MEALPIFEWMSAEEKLARARHNAGPTTPKKKKRPCDMRVELTPEEQAELSTLSSETRATRYRAILAERGV